MRAAQVAVLECNASAAYLAMAGEEHQGWQLKVFEGWLPDGLHFFKHSVSRWELSDSQDLDPDGISSLSFARMGLSVVVWLLTLKINHLLPCF